MRILHITPYFAPAFCYGGPPRSVLGLCRGLQALGAEVGVFTTTANGAAAELTPSAAGWSEFDGVPVRYFRRAFPRRSFGAAGLGAALAEAARDFDVWHTHGLWNVPAWQAAARARRDGVPYVLSPRGMFEAAARALHRRRKQLAFHAVERRNLSAAALLHATSAAEAERLAAAGLGPPIAVVPNGVELPPAEWIVPGQFRPRLPRAAAPIIAFVGRLHPYKRLDLLAAALPLVHAAHPDAQLVIAGPDEGGYRNDVAPLFAASAGAVHWTGELGEREKWALLADADVLVLCSGAESFGLSVAEALAAGTPAVVTRSCPWPDLERHRCGRWVAHSADAIAAGIVEILGDPAAAQAMGARGQALIAAQYSWRGIAGTMLEHYGAIAARQRSARA